MTNRFTLAQFCSAARRKGPLALCLALCTLGLGFSEGARKPGLTTFDVPGTDNRTFAICINSPGAVTGYYRDADRVFHGFLRAKSGSITKFGAPDAGTGPFQGTFAFSLNPVGTIAGYYSDANNVF